MSTQPPQPPYYPPPGGPQQYPPYQPQKKKTSPLVWILVALGGIVLLCVLAVVGAGFFVYSKAKQAGFDPAMMKKNPALATVKMMAALNPDIEVINYDDDRGIVNVKDKKSGKTYSVNFEDAKKGKFVFQEDGKPPVTITAGGDGTSGTVDIQGADGSKVKIGGGGGAKVPTWVPEYPGSDPQGVFSAQSGEGGTGSYAFKTKDPVEKVAKFYEDGFKSMGLRTTSTVSRGDGQTSGGMLSAEADKRSAVVLFGMENGDTTVSVTYTLKK